MKFETAIDLFITDMWTQGRITSPSSERGYRSTLMAHAEDVQNRDPAYVGREDVWSGPSGAGRTRTRRARTAQSS
jgi:hypothetical protein